MTKENELHIVNNRIEEAPLVFKTKDVIGNTVYLKEATLEFHIAGEAGDHPDRHFLTLENNLLMIQRVIEDPTQIFSDKMYENKLNYFSTVVFESHSTLKNVKIITETVGHKQQDIVTIIPQKYLREKYEGRIIYDRYSNK